MASRSLGQLTIDLVAKIGGFTQGMTQAERVADQKSRDIKRKLDQHAKDIEGAWTGMAKVLAASFAGISVGSLLSGMVGVAKETANAATEIDRFATLSNTSAQSFQRLAYGAQTVGISGEKLADIFKDVQDKFGDFAQTGGGEMADFFEKIAPRVGVTIEQFRRLSGPDALQLYVSSLQKANLSQQDMVFYMEAVANDSTLLLPLLQNNGKAWKELGDEAQRTGAIMNDHTLAAAKAFQEEARKLDGALQGVRVEIADKLLPVLTEMNRNLADPNTQDGIRKTVGLLADMATKVVQLSNEFFLGMKYADGFWDALFKYGTTNPFKSSKDQLASLQKELKQAQEDANTATLFKTEALRKSEADRIRSLQQQVGYWQARVNSDLDKENEFLLRNYRSRAPAVAPAAGPLSPVTPPKSPDSKGKSQAEKDREAADQFLKSLQEQIFKTQEKTAYEQLFFDIQNKGLKLSSKQLDKATGLATMIDMAKEKEKERVANVERQNLLYEMQERLLSKNQQYQLLLMQYGMGDQAAATLRERVELLQQQQAELRKLQQDQAQALAGTDDAKEITRITNVYAERLRVTKQAQQHELEMYDEFIQHKRQKEQDWLLGAQSALNSYIESATNVYDQTRQVATNALSNIEDAFLTMTMNGKFSFKSLANSVIADILRMQIRAQMSGLFGSLLGAIGIGGLGSSGTGVSASSVANTEISFGGFRAAGGPVSAGKMYEVNERGVPELLNVGGRQMLMMAQQSGTITPLVPSIRQASAPAAHALEGARISNSSVVISPTINIDSGTDKAQIQALVLKAMDIAVQQAQAELLDKMSRGMA